ncbi:metalloregulator ArsR/SmtB family transcription factor [Acidisoma cellulosilytica]|uniref:Metalloregulator ArsR/SmtB family transcription factor n=2 Tax=Acidisoma cellulosilyticum TaxID=2802395 RepID=A0A963Z5X1_9PROT|nr:metalloregulator ArsR/SmtB family transcription factor [Acidisoma cellulosilyticum]
METFLSSLRAAAEPTRMRILALCTRGAFCVSELVTILGQSQPSLSRHLRLLVEAGLLRRQQEGVFSWFALADAASPEGALARSLVSRLPEDDAVLAADRRMAAQTLSERARSASDSFRAQGADWDEMTALGLPKSAVEAALASVAGQGRLGQVLDIGTGTGRVLELLGPRADSGLGVDASPQMLKLARTRLAQAGLPQCSLRQADMYRLPLPDGGPSQGFDVTVLQMVLHHAEDPEAVLREAARVTRTGGRIIIVELASHTAHDLAERLAHRHRGFMQPRMRSMLMDAGLALYGTVTIPGPIATEIWSGAVNSRPQTPIRSSSLADHQEAHP